jgi:chlorobactene glucosyltransferase
MPFLTPQHPTYQDDDPPLVSVLIPARDEEESISKCLLSVLHQSYLRLEVIIIDDRSQDGTANVVREIAARDPRVRLISTVGLPPGWTGKNHALVTGVHQARGDWLVFIDSDTRHQADNLSILMEYARREGADMVSLLPRMRNRSFWERVVQPLASIMLMLKFPLSRINDDSDLRTSFANGQYILIRRNVYDALGGHASVRDKFVEDIHLAKLAKASGYRVRVALAPEISSTRMYSSLRCLVRGWSRILYAAYDHSFAQLAAILAGLVAFSLSGYAVLVGTLLAWWHGHPSAFVSGLLGMCVTHLFLQTSVMVRAYSLSGNKARYVAFYAIACGAMFWILVSALRKCCTHRVVWRGTQYDRLEDVAEALPVILPLPAPVLSPVVDGPLKRSA